MLPWQRRFSSIAAERRGPPINPGWRWTFSLRLLGMLAVGRPGWAHEEWAGLATKVYGARRGGFGVNALVYAVSDGFQWTSDPIAQCFGTRGLLAVAFCHISRAGHADQRDEDGALAHGLTIGPGEIASAPRDLVQQRLQRPIVRRSTPEHAAHLLSQRLNRANRLAEEYSQNPATPRKPHHDRPTHISFAPHPVVGSVGEAVVIPC